MQHSRTPTLLFAYSNDRRHDGSYLRNIPEERRKICSALEAASKRSQCDVVDLPNATYNEIIRSLLDERHGDRISVFHFAGHAGDAAVMLETREGFPSPAYTEGLAQVLGRQNFLKLVFLNGCATSELATALLVAGVPSVITTIDAIDDAIAADLAGLFYQGIAAGRSIQRSFDDATSAIEVRLGSCRRAAYRRSFVPPAKGELAWPWRLYPGREGQSRIINNVPESCQKVPGCSRDMARSAPETDVTADAGKGDPDRTQKRRLGERRKGERRKGEKRKGKRRSGVDRRKIGPEQRFKNGLWNEYHRRSGEGKFQSLEPVSVESGKDDAHRCDIVFSDGEINFHKFADRLKEEARRYRLVDKGTGSNLDPDRLGSILRDAAATAWAELQKEDSFKRKLIYLVEVTGEVVARRFRVTMLERRSGERRVEERRNVDRRLSQRRGVQRSV